MTTEQQTTRSFSIGQVIYVLSNKAQKIVPAIVVEEVLVKKLDGNQVSWKVSVGPAGKEKVIDSSRLDGDIYTNLQDIRDVLNRKLSNFLDELVGEAEKRAVTWYGHQVTKNVADPSASGGGVPDQKVDPDSLLADIETAPVLTKQPGPTGSFVAQQQHNPLGDELRRRMEGIADHETPLGGTLTEQVELPDGQRVKVNIKL